LSATRRDARLSCADLSVYSARVHIGRLAAACVAIVALGGPAVASAKTQVGTGGDPSAVGAPDGTSHVFWEDGTGNTPVAHYCQVAPGGESCAAEKTWSGAGTTGFEGEVVRDPGTGTVHVVVSIWAQGANTVFTSGGGIYDIASTQPDAAGNTWAAPVRITNYNTNATQVGNAHKGTLFGPGAHQISWLSSVGTNGARITFGSTSGFSESAVTGLVKGDGEANIGLIDAATPLIVGRDLDTGVFSWRAYGGTGPINDPSNWKPQGSLPADATSSSIDLGSNGVAAPALITEHQVGGTDWQVQLRRFDNAANAFGAPSVVSEDDSALDPQVFLDPASNVHALFLSNTKRYAGDQTTGLVYTASANGNAWPKYGITLDQGTSNTDPALAAGADGTGVAVWTRDAGNGSSLDDGVYLGRVGGPASAFPTDPPAATPPGQTPPATQPPPVDPSCIKLPALGIAKLLSTGCFKKTTGTKLTTSAPFLLNGITIDPKGKAVTIDTAKRTLSAPGTATALTMGPIKVLKGALDWTFPATGSWKKPGATIDLDAPGYGAELLGLELTGDATLTLTDAKSALTGFLRLPSPFSGVTAQLGLRADNYAGLHLDGLKSHVDQLGFGFHDLDLSYTSDPATWTGSLHFSPSGTEGSGVDLGAEIRFLDGKLDKLAIDAKFPAPGRELYPPLVYLRYAGLELQTSPLTLIGKVVVAGGASPSDNPLISVGRPYDDPGTLKLQLASPFLLRADGPVYVLGTKLGAGYFQYTYPGDIDFGAYASVGTCGSSVAAMSASVKGFVSVGSGFKMNAKGEGKVCLGAASVGATAVISSKGIAACASFGVEPFTVSAGAGLYWGDLVPDLMPLLCDTAPYEVAGGASASAAQAGGGRPIKVGAGLKQLDVIATGDSGVPLATLIAPDGTRYAGQAEGVVHTGPAWAVAEPDLKRQTFLVAKPAAGTWTLETTAGSPAIASLKLGRDAPPITVTGRVTRTGHGAGRALAWKVSGRSGQTVTFYEQGSGVLRRLGTAKGSTGTVRWAPKTVRGGKRTVTAVVERDGLATDQLTLGTFAVPKPRKPGVARKLRATHRGGALVITWVPGRDAARQQVRVTLGNGIGRIFGVSKRTKRLKVPAVAATVTGTVAVVALRADGAEGKTALVTVRAAEGRTAGRR
jgi:hypothetical protein